MKGLMKYPVAESTGRAHSSIDEILAENRGEYQQEQYDLHGTVGPTPFMETDEGQQSLMDIAMGSAFPGAAIGRVSKAAVTGGQRILSNKIWKQPEAGRMRTDEEAANILMKYFKDLMKPKPKPGPKNRQITPKMVGDSFKREQPLADKIKWDNKVNASRINLEKAYNKSGIQHERQLMDPVSEILRGYKYRKN